MDWKFLEFSISYVQTTKSGLCSLKVESKTEDERDSWTLRAERKSECYTQGRIQVYAGGHQNDKKGVSPRAGAGEPNDSIPDILRRKILKLVAIWKKQWLCFCSGWPHLQKLD